MTDPCDASPYRRGGMQISDRLATMTLVSGGAGALIGGYLGGKHAARQYLAERAHRLPTTVEGWFFYQKWKNYRVVIGSLKGAGRYARRLGACVGAFVAIESALDRLVGHTQIASSAAAGLGTAVGLATKI
ncbi:hypothetical protein IWW55_002443 [Coemansia sp. RSA 2706]|nr:hypothetical protein IWW55_002443 [Coemansia sp. RSA 2706]